MAVPSNSDVDSWKAPEQVFFLSPRAVYLMLWLWVTPGRALCAADGAGLPQHLPPVRDQLLWHVQ